MSQVESKQWLLSVVETVPYPSGTPRYCHEFRSTSPFGQPLAIPWVTHFSTSSIFNSDFVYVLKRCGWRWA